MQFPVIGICVAIQIALLIVVVWQLRRQALGKIGFLVLAATFAYHGLTELFQFAFPNRDPYRDLTTSSAISWWMALITSAMALYVAGYLLKVRVRRRALVRAPEMVRQLEGTVIFRWQFLLGLSVPSFLLLILRQQNASSAYWSEGLADQFTPYLLAICFALLGLKSRGRQVLLLFGSFGLFFLVTGSRLAVLSSALVALATMARYGVRVSRKNLISISAALLACLVIISASRFGYGRFNAGESFTERFRVMASAGVSEESVGSGQLLDDIVYRLDSNSFGALILDHQSAGYQVTGIDQIRSTIEYMVPSFIYTSKLTGLEDYQRNEEGYDGWFYDLPDLDYVSDFWSLLTGYVGAVGVLIVAPFLGWIIAVLDNWLDRKTTTGSFLVGMAATIIAMNLEQGIAGGLFVVRAFVVLILFSWAVKGALSKYYPGARNNFQPGTVLVRSVADHGEI